MAAESLKHNTANRLLALAKLLDNPPDEMDQWEYDFIEQHATTVEEMDVHLRSELIYTEGQIYQVDRLYEKFEDNLDGPAKGEEDASE